MLQQCVAEKMQVSASFYTDIPKTLSFESVSSVKTGIYSGSFEISRTLSFEVKLKKGKDVRQ